MMLVSGLSQAIPHVKIKTEKARVLLDSEPPKLEITRKRGGFGMESHPIQLDIDNRAFFDSMGLKSISALADDMVTRSKKAVLDSIARYGQEAELLGSPKIENAISQIALMRTQKSMETMLVFIPQEPPKLHWTGGWVEISYTPDSLNFQWNTGGVKKTYIPYSVDFSVEE